MVPIIKGQSNQFYWLEITDGSFCLQDLLRNFPDILLNKFLAVAYFDSSPLKLVSEEITEGWYEKNDIAYSPMLTESLIKHLPCEQYDQWYLFSNQNEIVQTSDFANHSGFSLANQPIDQEGKESGFTGKDWVRKFWEELELINPQSFILDGDNFIFVSKSEKEIEQIELYCS